MIGKELRKSIISVIIRAPALLVIEMVFLGHISLKNLTFLRDYPNLLNSPYLDHFLYILSWILLLLPYSYLLAMYKQVFCFKLVFLSHHLFNLLAVTSNSNCENAGLLSSSYSTYKYFEIFFSDKIWLEKAFSVFLIQFILFLTSFYISGCKDFIIFVWPLTSWISIVFKNCFSLKIDEFAFTTSVFFTSVYILFKALKLCGRFKLIWLKIKLVLSVFGWSGIATWIQMEYKIQKQLMFCWFIRFVYQFYINFNDSHKFISYAVFWPEKYLMSVQSFPFIVAITIPQCLTTSINLFGLAIVVSEIVKFQYFCMRYDLVLICFFLYFKVIKNKKD